MVNCIEIPFNRFPASREAQLAYERRFGAPPEWLDDLSGGQALALLRQALRRGAPLIAADVLI